MPKLRKHRQSKASKVGTRGKRLSSKVVYWRDGRGRFAHYERSLEKKHRIAAWSKRTGKRLTKPVSILPVHEREYGVSETSSFWGSYRKLSRGKPKGKYFHHSSKLFSSSKKQNLTHKYQTCCFFLQVISKLNVKTSELASVSTEQVWIRRLKIDKPRPLSYWLENMQDGEFIYSILSDAVRAFGGELIDIIGIEGIK